MEIKPRQLEIIEATGKILTQSGINGLTIKRLADEMNFSESAIYRHFESKEDIILTLLKYLTQNISAILDKIPCTSNADEDLKTVFRRITAYFFGRVARREFESQGYHNEFSRYDDTSSTLYHRARATRK